MRVLVIGSGGREHALVWKIAQSRLVDKIFCAPGNGGIAQQAECVDIKAEDVAGLLDFARKEHIALTIVGPEIPLAKGIVDEFLNYRLPIFGPQKKAAQLEASKVFAKELMFKYNVPTANFKIFDEPEAAKKYITTIKLPCVIKADGLAQGKGVVVANNLAEAHKAIEDMMVHRIFGEAARRVIIEDFLEGQEASILVLTDSRDVLPLASSQDHKRVFDNDQGPNTGGMGAYSPAPLVTPSLHKEIMDKIIYRIIDGLAREGIEYQGVLYAGIMVTKDGPKVLEFNVRFGDPETQVILPRLSCDLLEIMLAVVDKKLNKINLARGIRWDRRACVCVVCASKGYPGEYEKGKEIFGLDEVANLKDVVVFHAGTKRLSFQEGRQANCESRRTKNEERQTTNKEPSTATYITSGGRVLGVTGLGVNLKEAIDITYDAVNKISFSGMHYRRDIGAKALALDAG